MTNQTGAPAAPRATVRLQFNGSFGFREATALVPYFAALGISHVYASPFLRARGGSTHGYDIIDHNQFDPEIGSPETFEEMVEALRLHGMGLILDFVPNHMGVGGHDNGWWLDVLEWGQGSPFASFFDIDWHPVEQGLKGKVLLPVLGDHYGNVLERGELELRLDEERGSFSVWYYVHRFPIAVHDYPRILKPVADALGEGAAALAPLIEGFRQIGAAARSGQNQATVRRDADELRRRLGVLAVEDEAVRTAIRREVDRVNGVAGRPESFADLHRLLEDQAYRVAYWRVASDEINYRRFFDVNDLAGLRIVEEPELFELAHQLVFRLITEGKLHGVRLDHIDGLYDPLAYCRRVQERAGYLMIQAAATGQAPRQEAPGLVLREPLYLLVEKILARHEHLREDWPVAGTTGYEFMALVNGLFVDPAAEAAMTESYHRFIGRSPEFEDMVVQAKRQIVTNNLASELKVLADEMHRLAAQSWSTRDFTLTGIRRALIDITSYFPVYRTYVCEGQVSEEDRRYIDWAVAQARKRSGLPDTSVYDFIHDVLTTDLGAGGRGGYRQADVLRTAMKFQQFTGPAMAKSVEDTTFYRYVRLVSLNEVGGEPGRWSTTPAAFHHINQERLRRHPYSMLATATHDHKRGEDTRLRIDALSEMPADWNRHVRRWARLNRFKKREIDARPAPGRNDEYLLYQTLAGAWPLDLRAPGGDGMEEFRDRVAAYMLKAVRESKLRSSWSAPDADYESALERFVHGILDPARSAGFLADFQGFQDRVARIAAISGLSQPLLRTTVPGVPDLYQGTEFWDLSLVDPDNRRPVDWERRRSGLDDEDRDPDPAALLRDWRDGRIKQHVVARALRLRQRLPALFAVGDYLPVEAVGPHAERVVAFLRRFEGAAALVVAPRLVGPLLDEGDLPMVPPSAWDGTTLLLPELPAGIGFADALSGGSLRPPEDGRIEVAGLLDRFPVALLYGEG
ncbi:malto-oligosyltrehalose synthase [Arenibaculum sp.]|jgi:(1->4)-alpha-D-glucan 1-alpha-D-glucosylmutase|uniref:malto-oligosyltrehalose synthase n=1 Tax=Arenibaculum sp. TaxID=2865862 RepID=UPI002E0DC350|nr:malto-oligosyltrehalose synthase [Arenibaculum sp.]